MNQPVVKFFSQFLCLPCSRPLAPNGDRGDAAAPDGDRGDAAGAADGVRADGVAGAGGRQCVGELGEGQLAQSEMTCLAAARRPDGRR
jgi:hypothetical protein